jgi:hypothetical protein
LLAVCGDRTAAATTKPRLIIDLLAIFTLGADLSGPTGAADQLGAFVTRFRTIHERAAILMTATRVPHFGSPTFTVGADMFAGTIPRSTTFLVRWLTDPSTADFAAAAFAVVGAGTLALVA